MTEQKIYILVALTVISEKPLTEAEKQHVVRETAIDARYIDGNTQIIESEVKEIYNSYPMH